MKADRVKEIGIEKMKGDRVKEMIQIQKTTYVIKFNMDIKKNY